MECGAPRRRFCDPSLSHQSCVRLNEEGTAVLCPDWARCRDATGSRRHWCRDKRIATHDSVLLRGAVDQEAVDGDGLWLEGVEFD